jgi:hypothetical protein
MRRTALLILLFIVLTAAMAFPWSMHPASQVLADVPDIHLFIWTLAWNTQAFTHQPFSIFDANTFYPLHNSLAFSENLIGTSFTSAPVIWLTGNPVLAMNLAALLTCVLCGLGAFRLARSLGLGMPAAVIGGIVFAFAPPRFMRMGQIHMTAVQWVPFALAYLHQYFDRGRRSDLRLAMAFFTLQVLTSGHGAAFLVVAIAALVAYRLAVHERLGVANWLADAGIGGALIVAPAALMMLPYRRAQQDVGLVRSLENWLPSSDSYLASPSHFHHWVLSFFTTKDYVANADAWLFPGYLPLLLGLVALVPLRKQFSAPFYAALLVICYLMFSNSILAIWPHVYWMPGFNFIRVPSRFAILAMLALGVVAATGFERLVGRARPAAQTAAAVIVGALLLGEFSGHPFGGVPFQLEIPAVDRWLDDQPKPCAIAEVPVPSPGNAGAFERHNTTAMLHSMAHWQKVVQGYSGIHPQSQLNFLTALTVFPDDVSMGLLIQNNVDYIVVHTEQYEPGKWSEVEARIATEPRLRLEHTADTGRVYRVLNR